MTAPDLDRWVADPVVRVAHRREGRGTPAELWAAARTVRLSDTRVLGRLVRLRIPGVEGDPTYDELFHSEPFAALEEGAHSYVAGLCGRIWTLRRDYAELDDPEQFAAWSEPGTVRVLYANWVTPAGPGRAAITSETRVAAVDRDGRRGLRAVRPLITAFNRLIATEPLALAIRRAEAEPRRSRP